MSRPFTAPSPSEIRDFAFSPYDSLESLVFRNKISCRWVKVVLTNEGTKEGHPSPLKRRYSTGNGSSNVKMIADRHRHAA